MSSVEDSSDKDYFSDSSENENSEIDFAEDSDLELYVGQVAESLASTLSESKRDELNEVRRNQQGNVKDLDSLNLKPKRTKPKVPLLKLDSKDEMSPVSVKSKSKMTKSLYSMVPEDSEDVSFVIDKNPIPNDSVDAESSINFNITDFEVTSSIGKDDGTCVTIENDTITGSVTCNTDTDKRKTTKNRKKKKGVKMDRSAEDFIFTGKQKQYVIFLIQCPTENYGSIERRVVVLFSCS